MSEDGFYATGLQWEPWPFFIILDLAKIRLNWGISISFLEGMNSIKFEVMSRYV